MNPETPLKHTLPAPAALIRTCDWPRAGGAALGEQLSEAVGAVGLLIATGEPLAGQARVAVGAREALAVPRLLLVGHAAGGDDLAEGGGSGQPVDSRGE